MAELSQTQKSGELSDEAFLFKEITWKIPNEKILPNHMGLDIQSPTFSFAGGTWILHIYPYGNPGTTSCGWIAFVIERLDNKVPYQHVFYKFYFKTKRGKEFNPIQDMYTFNGYCTRSCLLYMQKSSFLLNEKVVTVKGNFIIVCQIRTQKINGIEMFAQTEAVELFSELSEEKSKQELLPSTSGFKELSEEKSKQELLPSTSGFKDSEEDKPAKESESSATTYKEPLEKNSTEEPAPHASKCKGCDCVLRSPFSLPGIKTLRDFKELYLNQEDCDVIIKVKGQEFPAHKNILKARSPVFASTFRNDMKEKATGVIDIEDCDPSSFSDFLCFLYCGNVENLSTENAFSLFTTADKYDVQDLRLECVQFLKNNLSVETFCDTIALALQHSEKVLIEVTIDFFIKNLQEIIVTVKWQSFLIEYPIQSNELLIKALVSNKK